MAFTLPSDLPTNVVDDVTEVNAAFFNNLSGMGNSMKAALATWGINAQATTVTTSESTASTSYTDLTTTTDSVTAAIGSSGKALVIIRAKIDNQADWGAYVGYALSGANTVAATDAKCIRYWYKGTLSAVFFEENLTAGFTTFKLKYKATSGTATFADRRIIVIPFPATDGTHASGDFTLADTISMAMAGAGINRPTYDALGDGYYNASTNTGGSFSHTGTSGATPILAVAVGVSTGDSVYSATYNGVAMTELGRSWATSTGGTGVILYGLVGACTGSACTVSFTSSKTIDQAITMNCASYTGVAAFGKPVAAAGGATAPTSSITTIEAGGLAVNGMQVQRSTAITGYNQTSRYSDARGTYQALQFGECAVQNTTGATVTFSATTGNNWAEFTVPLLATAPPIMPDKVTSTVVGSGTKSISSTTFQHTGTSGTTPIVAVSLESDNAPFLSSTIACTYNGAAMTLIGYVPCYSTYDITIALFGKVGACTGSAVDVVVTNSPNCAGVMACCVSYTNVTSFKVPALQTQTTSQPSLTVTSAAGDRVVAAGHNHLSGAKGYSQINGITRFNNNTYTTSSPYQGTTYMADAPASGATTAMSAYTSISYGQGGVGAALSTASPVSIAYDATGGGATQVGAGTASWTHNINSNFLLIWNVYYNTGAFNPACTVGGVSIGSGDWTATQGSDYRTYYAAAGNYMHIRWWYLFNPPQGNQTISLIYSSGGPVRSSQNSVSYTNVGKMLDPVFVNVNSTSISATAWKMTPSGLYAGCVANSVAGDISAFNKTSRYSTAYSGGTGLNVVAGDAPGSTSDTSFTATTATGVWGAFILPLIPTTYT